MKALLTLIALSSTAVLSANPYYDSSYGNQGSQSQNYQNNPQAYNNQGGSYDRSQGYDRGMNSNSNGYNQGYYQDGSNQGYSQDGYNQGSYQGQSNQGYNSQDYNEQNSRGNPRGDQSQMNRNQMQNQDSNMKSSYNNSRNNNSYISANDYSDNTPVNNYDNKYPQDSAATAQDRELNAKIRSKLEGGWFSKGFETVTIKTTNGDVVITGTVPKTEDIQKVSDRIKDIKGIKSLTNQLTARQ
jgi:osmotically-inducible protein OsmY